MARSRYVYVISSPLGFTKIGWSIDPEERRRLLSTSHPVELTLHAIWPHDRAPTIEIAAHALLAGCRTNGEWFQTSSDTAVQAVSDAIAALIPVTQKTPKKYKVRLDKPPSYTWTWNKDRRDALSFMWETGQATREILNTLNSLPGSQLTMVQVCAKAAVRNLRRPEWMKGVRDPQDWSETRLIVLTRDYPAGVLPEPLLTTLNALPGSTLRWIQVRSRARSLGLVRPEGFNAIVAEALSRKQGTRWTVERDVFLKNSYEGGALPLDILMSLSALPGPQDLTWEIVRERAKHRNWRRPEGFMRELGHANRMR